MEIEEEDELMTAGSSSVLLSRVLKYGRRRGGDRGAGAGKAEEGGARRRSKMVDRTRYAQPALFAVEYALAELWASVGVVPGYAVRHSVGELAAACVAGAFGVEDGLGLVEARGRLMGGLERRG